MDTLFFLLFLLEQAARAHDYARIQAGHAISKMNFLDQVCVL